MSLKTGFKHMQGVESKWALGSSVYKTPIQDGCLGCKAYEMWREFASTGPTFSYPGLLPWWCSSQNVRLIHHHTVPRWAINKPYLHYFTCSYELCLDSEKFSFNWKLKTADTWITTINSLYIQAWDMSKCLLWLWFDGISPAFWQIINQYTDEIQYSVFTPQLSSKMISSISCFLTHDLM